MTCLESSCTSIKMSIHGRTIDAMLQFNHIEDCKQFFSIPTFDEVEKIWLLLSLICHYEDTKACKIFFYYCLEEIIFVLAYFWGK